MIYQWQTDQLFAKEITFKVYMLNNAFAPVELFAADRYLHAVIYR